MITFHPTCIQEITSLATKNQLSNQNLNIKEFLNSASGNSSNDESILHKNNKKSKAIFTYPRDFSIKELSYDSNKYKEFMVQPNWSFQTQRYLVQYKQNFDCVDDKYKTVICKKWLKNNMKCSYGARCRFAHGKNELNKKILPKKWFYKSKNCISFHQNEVCPYGVNCLFVHKS